MEARAKRVRDDAGCRTRGRQGSRVVRATVRVARSTEGTDVCDSPEKEQGEAEDDGAPGDGSVAYGTSAGDEDVGGDKAGAVRR